MFADVMLRITSASAPIVYAPNDSPMSQFRSTDGTPQSYTEHKRQMA
jgi:hypothetical protein